MLNAAYLILLYFNSDAYYTKVKENKTLNNTNTIDVVIEVDTIFYAVKHDLHNGW